MSKVLDANAMLRYLLDDIPQQHDETARCIDSGGACVYPEVLAEVVYVLGGVYGVSRPEVATGLLQFLDEVSVYDREMLEMTLRVYGESKLDFVDCLLMARNSVLRENVLSFDKQLNKRLCSWGL